MSEQHPFERGKRNAEAIIMESGLAWAEKWLTDRTEQPAGRKPLDPRYIDGYNQALDQERKNPTQRVEAPTRYRITTLCPVCKDGACETKSMQCGK